MENEQQYVSVSSWGLFPAQKEIYVWGDTSLYYEFEYNGTKEQFDRMKKAFIDARQN